MALNGPWDDYAGGAMPEFADGGQALGAAVVPQSVPNEPPAAPAVQLAPLQSAAPQAGPWDDYASPDASIPDAHNPVGHAFRDSMPVQPVHRLTADDEATLSHLLRTADAPTIKDFLAQRGMDEPGVEAYVINRDRARAKGLPVSYDVTYTLPTIKPADGAAGAAQRGFGSGATANFLDEAGAVVDALGGTPGRPNVWNSDQGLGDLYDTNLDYNRAILAGDEREHPYITTAGNLAGGLVLPFALEGAGLTKGMSEVAKAAYSDARIEGFSASDARAIAAKAVAQRTAGEGAAYGAAYGAGGADGGSDRLTGALSGAIEGGTLGGVIGAAGKAAAPALYAQREAARALPIEPLSEAAQVAQAADRQGIAILPQDIGGEGVGRATQGAAQSTFGSSTIRNAANRLYDTFSGRVGDLAGDAPSPVDAGAMVGERAQQMADRAASAADRTSEGVQSALSALPADATESGQMVRRGLASFQEDTSARASDLYGQVPIAQNQPARLDNTRRLLNDLTAQWTSNPDLGEMFGNSRLSGYLDALTPTATATPTGLLDAAGNPITRDVTNGGGLSWGDLSQFRTRVGDMLSDPNLTEKIAPRQLRALYGALSSDMEATAREAGPAAFARWKRANNFYDGRMKRINDTFALVLGTKGDATPNAVYASLQSMLKTGSTGNPAAFARVLRSMPADDANAVRASLVRDARGGSTFDPGKFASAWSQISERGKSALLPQAGMRSLMDDAAGRAGTDARNPLAGLSGEQIFAKLEQMAKSKGDSARFRVMMAGMSPEEANAVRSTFIMQGGRAAAGAQNADGNAFSISRWLTRWNDMSPQAKQVLFGDGELRSAMNDLAQVADKVKASERLAGHSNTGAVNSFDKTTGGLYGAIAALIGGTFSGHPLTGLGSAAILASPAAYQRVSAKILTSPKLLRYLARAPKKVTYGERAAYLTRLSRIAVTEPQSAGAARILEDYLRHYIAGDDRTETVH